MQPFKKWNLTPGSKSSGRPRKPKEHNFNRSDLFPPDAKVTLVIDGSNHFVRNCSIPNLSLLTNPAGQKTGGIYGTLKSIVSEIRLWRPSTIYFVLDKSGSHRKKGILPEYKAGRGGGLQTQLTDNLDDAGDAIQAEIMEQRQEAEARQRQLDVLEKLLPNIGIRFVSVSGVEADDLIGAIASIHPHSVVSSTDTDFIQLHDGVSCVVYNPATGRIRTVEDFGVIGRSYAILKSVIGDPTDNIRGLERVGWKTIIKWCDGSYPNSLEELKQQAQSKPDKLGQKILDNWEMVERNFSLISLHPDVTMVYPHLLLKIKAWTQNRPRFSLKDALTILKPENIGMQILTEAMAVLTNLK
jgi:DNA polymerase-1